MRDEKVGEIHPCSSSRGCSRVGFLEPLFVCTTTVVVTACPALLLWFGMASKRRILMISTLMCLLLGCVSTLSVVALCRERNHAKITLWPTVDLPPPPPLLYLTYKPHHQAVCDTLLFSTPSLYISSLLFHWKESIYMNTAMIRKLVSE